MKNDKGCVVVMNFKIGEVLLFVSSLLYNLNEFILGMLEDRWNEFNKNENKLMYNRFKVWLCFGFFFKLVIVGIGIIIGKINLNENFGYSSLSW